MVAVQDEAGSFEAAAECADGLVHDSVIEADYYRAAEPGCMNGRTGTNARCVMTVGKFLVVIGRKVVNPPVVPGLNAKVIIRWRLAAVL